MPSTQVFNKLAKGEDGAAQVNLERQSLWDMYQMRGLFERSHGRWIATDSKSTKIIPWATQWEGPEHVLFGHDSRKGLQVRPLNRPLHAACRCWHPPGSSQGPAWPAC